MFVLLHTERECLERMKKSFFSRVKNICVCFFCILFRVYNPNFKNCFSLRVEKKNKTLTRVLIKGGASLSLLFSSLITSSIPLREEHERRLSSYNEQQRKERAREEETTLFFCSFLPFYLRSKLWEEERRLICFLKGVLRWKFCKSFSII